MDADDPEVYVSVDIEASGPVPGEYSMLALGAVVVGDEDGDGFYAELKPITDAFQEEAMAVCRLDLGELTRTGEEPAEAMARFEQWLGTVIPQGARPVFAAYPVAFDWMFVAYYFHRFLGHNPFGFAGLDIQSYYAGMVGTTWAGARKARMDPRFQADVPLPHNALADARIQGRLLHRLLTDRDASAPRATERG